MLLTELKGKISDDDFELLGHICKQNEISFDGTINFGRKLQYIISKYDLSDDQTINIIIRFINFSKAEKKVGNGKDFCNFHFADFVKFFEQFDWDKMSFSTNKSQIKTYLDWCRNNNLCEIDTIRELEKVKSELISKKNLYKKSYFRDFNELNTAVKEKIAKKSGTESAKYDTPKIALYLMWYGINVDDACEIKKTDIDENAHRIFIERTGEYISVDDDKAMQEIVDYRDSQGYVLQTGKHYDFAYKDSLMLLRSKLNSKLRYSILQTQVSNFFSTKKDDISDEKNIKLLRTYWSGIYSRLHDYEEKNNIELGLKDMELLKEKFKMEDDAKQNAIYQRFSVYCDYCSYLFGTHHFG